MLQDIKFDNLTSGHMCDIRTGPETLRNTDLLERINAKEQKEKEQSGRQRRESWSSNSLPSKLYFFGRKVSGLVLMIVMVMVMVMVIVFALFYFFPLLKSRY